MKIDRNKCKVLVFNPHKNHTELPQLTLSVSGRQRNIYMLYGSEIKEWYDMSWKDNTAYIYARKTFLDYGY